jgi:formylglycine-generating enzyme required for sulfatase activity
VKKALELGKPIFPIVLEKIENWAEALTQIGLTPNNHTEDFTDAEKWDAQIERLLRSLHEKGLRVTPHDIRRERDPNNKNYILHQTYLKRLAERVGTVNLAQISPDSAHGVELEQVYVDSPTPLSISVQVQDWQIIEWWIDSHHRFGTGKHETASVRYKPEQLGYETAPFEAIIGQLDDTIARYHEQNPDAKPDPEYLWDNRWRNGEHKNVLALHLNHIAAAQKRLVILGAPGSGKSTFVRYLALCLAGAGIDNWEREVDSSFLSSWSHGALTPVYIELRHFVASKHFPTDVKTPVTADHLWAYIQHELLGDELVAYTDDLKYDLEHGHAVLILDGLDEVSYPENKLKDRQNQLISLARSLNTRYATSRMIVASRPYAYEGWTLPNFSTITITAFNDHHRIDLAKRLYHVAGLNDTEANQKAGALNRQLEQIDRELKDRPLFVTLMATIYLKGNNEGLPTRRGTLYRESILLLLDRWTTTKPDAPSLTDILGDHSADDLYQRLAALAYDVHQHYGDQPGTPEIDEGLLYRHLKPLGRGTAAELIPYLSENAGVLVSLGQDTEKDVFRFAHRTFQEYLAGAHLVDLCIKADSFTLIRDQIMSKPQVWRVPCTLVGDVLADTDRRGDLWDLLDDLLDDEVASDIPADDSRWWTVWLASVVFMEQQLIDGEKLRRREQVICDQLRDWTVALVETPYALEPSERAVGGQALGLVGDSRPGVGVISRDGVKLPDIDWVTIPAGEFTMGHEDEEDNPPRILTLDYEYQIARYLVTYAQFQAFVDAPDGVYHARWWEGLALPDGHNKTVGDQAFKFSNHPRENVSWYDAIAFCRWLSDKLGFEVRLPTEFEWEKAARGMTGWQYPYGDTFDALKGNTRETGIWPTSMVGIFPQGDTPHWEKPISDLSGNVWEWCLTDYRNPQIEPKQEDLRTDARRVLRGGSWNYVNFSARAVYRLISLPNDCRDDYGFRLVARRA